MAYIRFVLGGIIWHLKAGIWYLLLGFRLYFAVGLDQDFKGDREGKVKAMFHYPKPRTYRDHLNNG